MNWKISALLVARVTRDMSYEIMHNPPDMGKRVKRPVHVFLLEGPGKDDRILVDTGCPSAADGPEVWAPREFAQPVPDGGGPEAVRQALRSAGSDVSEVKKVILTHGHLENAWNVDLFPEAQLIVQRDEVESCFAPVPWQRLMYNPKVGLNILNRKKPSHCLILWGDSQIADGVTVMKTPGHTFGMQTAIVQTEKGKVAITAAGSTYHNWFPADPRFGYPLRVMADTMNCDPSIICRPWDAIREMERIKAAADIVVPVHDAAIPKKLPEQWWSCPPNDVFEKAGQFPTMAIKPGVYSLA